MLSISCVASTLPALVLNLENQPTPVFVSNEFGNEEMLVMTRQHNYKEI
jgi:hypothetical protein